jgi:hypothetical protein
MTKLTPIPLRRISKPGSATVEYAGSGTARGLNCQVLCRNKRRVTTSGEVLSFWTAELVATDHNGRTVEVTVEHLRTRHSALMAVLARASAELRAASQ